MDAPYPPVSTGYGSTESMNLFIWLISVAVQKGAHDLKNTAIYSYAAKVWKTMAEK